MILVWYGFAGAHNGIGMVWGAGAHNGDGMVWGAGAHNGNGMVWYGHGQLGRGIESNNTVLMCRDAESMTWSVGLTHCNWTRLVRPWHREQQHGFDVP